MPLIHRPGEAQVDFGYALAKVSGDLRKIAFFVMELELSSIKIYHFVVYYYIFVK
jgi:hypothetical protein